MKRFIYKRALLIIFLLAAFTTVSASVDSLLVPVKEGKVFYEKIVTISANLTKEELYNRTLSWFAKSFTDSKEVIEVSDKEAGMVIGKGTFEIFVKGAIGMRYRIRLVFEVTVKDGKYRMQAHNIERMMIGGTTIGEYYPIEYSWNKRSITPGTFTKKDDIKFYSLLNERIAEIMASFDKALSDHKKINDF